MAILTIPALDAVITQIQTTAAQFHLPLELKSITRRGPVTDLETVLFVLPGEDESWRFDAILMPSTYTIDFFLWKFNPGAKEAAVVRDTDLQLRMVQKPHNWELAIELALSHVAFQ